MDWYAYMWIAIGVVVAVVWPVLSGFIRKEFPPVAGVPPWAKRYGGLAIFSLLTAFIIYIFWRRSNPDAQLDEFQAFILGFSWESVWEKTFGRAPGRGGGGAQNPAPANPAAGNPHQGKG